MADFFLQLPTDERREALGVAAAVSGRPMHLLDKDVWVFWILEVLFQAPFATHLVFKGGSSLSKAYQIIRRFSEDVDLTYDIRVLAPDLVGGEAEPLPANRSQEKRWTKEIRTRLPLWISDQVVPLINRALSFGQVNYQPAAGPPKNCPAGEDLSPEGSRLAIDRQTSRALELGQQVEQ